MIQKELKRVIIEVLDKLKIEAPEIVLEHPADLSHGDFSTNAALACAKRVGKNPRELAKQVASEISKNQPKEIESVSVAGPGFINFKLSPKFLGEQVAKIAEDDNFGRNQSLKGKKIIVEYTDPNAFKPFHIGHLMANAIGESLSRLVEFSGANIVRVCYPSDIGLHIAKAVWGCIKNKNNFPKDTDSLTVKTAFLGKAYVEGTARYEDDLEAKASIDTINEQLFRRSDKAVLAVYEKGRSWSLDHFEVLYKRLGTKFDEYIYESEAAPEGLKIVKEFLDRGVFEMSEGAVVFHGEKRGLHTRVFVNSKGFPTYEAKDVGLNRIKFTKWNPDLSVIVTANEQNEYFKVVLAALRDMYPDVAEKTKHVSHGILRLPSGKMSSRTGNVITGESLLSAVEAMVHEKIAERELVTEEKNRIANEVSVGAIKYSILRQAIGGDIIFDFEKSISFEGDSGPYLQYSYARAQSVLRKASSGKILEAKPPKLVGSEALVLKRLLVRFPEIVERSQKELSPHYVATYLIEIAGAFNNFYANNKIIDSGEGEGYRLMLVKAFANVMKSGLYLLGIKSPEVM